MLFKIYQIDILLSQVFKLIGEIAREFSIRIAEGSSHKIMEPIFICC